MKLKLVQIGCGNHARNVYLPSLLRLKAEYPALEYAACCDIDEAHAASYAADAGFARHYTDFRQMIEREKPDAALATTAVSATPEVAAWLLKAGIPVLIEKPPAPTLEGALALMELAAQVKTPHQVAYNRRHIPLIRLMLKWLGDDEITHIDYRMHRVRRTEDYFYTTAVHGLDLCAFLAGSPCRQMHAVYSPQPGYEGVIHAQMLAEFENGATASMSFCPVSSLVAEQLMVTARHGAYYVDLPVWGARDGGSIEVYKDDKLIRRLSGKALPGGSEMFINNGFYDQAKSFLQDIAEGRAPRDSLGTAKTASLLAECMRLRQAEYCP